MFSYQDYFFLLDSGALSPTLFPLGTCCREAQVVSDEDDVAVEIFRLTIS
jgi:hypothetical protein